MSTDSSPKSTAECPTCGASVPPSHLIPVGDSFVCPTCRDQYLQGIKENGSMLVQDNEATRQEYLKHEASLKSVGTLYCIGALFLLLGGIMELTMVLTTNQSEGLNSASFTQGLIGFAIGSIVVVTVVFVVARGLRKIRPWVKIPGTLVASLGLLSFPIGTLINGYVLYLIWCRRGRFVLSPEYRLIIEATPHIKSKTSIIVWIFLGVIFATVLFLWLVVPTAATR